jgi:hypothetical protein
VTDAALVEDFRSDAARGKPRRGRARAVPEVHDGLSAFVTLSAARERWRDIEALASRRGQKVAIGDHVARVHLRSGAGFAYEDLGVASGHLTIWGDPRALAAAVREIVPVEVR